MPIYGIPQSGSNPNPALNLTSIQPGDTYTLLDGTEALAAGQSSVAFSRGIAPTGGISSLTFSVDFPTAPTAVLAIQASNTDTDAAYVTVYTSSGVQHDLYTDQGQSRFYRAKLISQAAGGSPTVKVS